jgi:hypothetical protein
VGEGNGRESGRSGSWSASVPASFMRLTAALLSPFANSRSSQFPPSRAGDPLVNLALAYLAASCQAMPPIQNWICTSVVQARCKADAALSF